MTKLTAATWPLTESDFQSLCTRREPVIFRGAAANWPCTRLWSPEYLAGKLGTKPVTVSRSETPLFTADPERGHYLPETLQAMPFSEFLQHAIAPSGAPHYYLHKHSLEKQLPELLEDIVVPEHIRSFQTLLISLWMGPKGSITPIHHDFTDNFFVQVRGTKRVILFPPEPEAAFYRMPFRAQNVRSSWHVSRVGSVDSANLGAFPNFAAAQPIDILVEQGDVLFIPVFYWHEVHSIDSPSVSLSYWWEERSLAEIDASIAKVTALVDLYNSASPAWRALIERIVSEHILRRSAP